MSRHDTAEQLTERVTRIDVERQELTVEIDRLPELIALARAESIRQAPAAASALNADVRRLSNRLDEATHRLSVLEAEREAVLTVLDEAQQEARETLLRGLVARAVRARTDELEGWREAGEQLAQLLATYSDKIVPKAREVETLRHEASAARLDVDDPRLAAAVDPFPDSPWAFLAAVFAVTVDPGRLGRRDAPVTPRDRALVPVTPDLRAVAGERVRLVGVAASTVEFASA